MVRNWTETAAKKRKNGKTEGKTQTHEPRELTERFLCVCKDTIGFQRKEERWPDGTVDNMGERERM